MFDDDDDDDQEGSLGSICLPAFLKQRRLVYTGFVLSSGLPIAFIHIVFPLRFVTTGGRYKGSQSPLCNCTG